MKSTDTVTVPATGDTIPVEAGDAWTCTFTNTRDTGTIEVVKELDPPGDPGLFDLIVDATTEATDVGDGGTTGAITVDTGEGDVEWEPHVVVVGQRGIGSSKPTTTIDVTTPSPSAEEAVDLGQAA